MNFIKFMYLERIYITLYEYLVPHIIPIFNNLIIIVYHRLIVDGTLLISVKCLIVS